MKCQSTKPTDMFYKFRKWRCKPCYSLEQKARDATPKIKATRKRYAATAKGKASLNAARKRYRKSAKGKAALAKRARSRNAPRNACRNAVRRMVAQAKKSGLAEKDCPLKEPALHENVDDVLGCTPAHAYEHLAATASHGETWAKYGKYVAGGPRKCEIDHIMPIASLEDSCSKEQWLRISHYSNCQLLWADLNTEKSDKIPKNWEWNDEKHAWEGDPDSWKE